MYEVGHAKLVEIDINGDGTDETYKVRVANNSHYYSETESANECKDNDGNVLTSQTACGFVVEFVDILRYGGMNNTDTNKGGWPASSMYKYINGDTTDHLTYGGTNATLYSKLPSDLRSVIADTTVISGHGSADKNTERTDHNWESTDKLYLLTSGEVYSNCLTGNCYDTASYPHNNSGATTTRQLDYYNGLTVTTSENYEKAIKQKNGSNSWWWLRGATAYNSTSFRIVYTGGNNDSNFAYNSGGVAPAFRIT